MTKYKVLKELPRAKVGDELEYDSFGNLNQEGFIGKTARVLDKDLVQDAFSEGFIEEIKEGGRWRAEKGKSYWFVDNKNVYRELDYSFTNADINYENGNYFKSRETAELVAEAVKLMYEWLHNGKPVFNDFENVRRAIENAHGAVLKDDRNE